MVVFRFCCSGGKAADLAKVNSADLQAAIDKKAGVQEPQGFVSKMYNKCKDAALYGTSVDIHEVVEEDPFIAALHARAEKFDEHAEHSFGYLQVGAGYAAHIRPAGRRVSDAAALLAPLPGACMPAGRHAWCTCWLSMQLAPCKHTMARQKPASSLGW